MTDEKKQLVAEEIYFKFMDFLDDSTVKEFIEDDPDTKNPHATRNTVKGYELYSMIELILDKHFVEVEWEGEKAKLWTPWTK
jgi:hypothetical protein|tara:strand:+ start:37 stop:282 length:246 start_codon:yes stop_codon:yes gene_type:complete